MEYSPTRILVIRFSSIGDIVLTTPVVRALKQQLDGEVEVHFLTKKKFAFILEANPYIHQIHAMDKTVQEVIPTLEKLDFDYIIDLHSNIRTRIVKKRLNRLAFTFDKLNFKKWLWVNLGINRMPDVHIVQRYLATTRAFGVVEDDKGLDYFIPEGQGFDFSKMPSSHDDGYLAFALGGAHIGKRMDAEKIAEMCRQIKHPIILLGGKEDEETGQKVAAQFPERILNWAGQLTLHQSADVLRIAEVVVAGDTGLMHIASAFGKKIISLWGCTVPGLGMSPYRPHHLSVMLEPHGRKRRPCSKLGNRCKYGESNRCIQHIENSEVLKAIEKLWAR